jgi:hypothetical protein
MAAILQLAFVPLLWICFVMIMGIIVRAAIR